MDASLRAPVRLGVVTENGALNSGNIGTMVRHHDTIVPFVVWLSALGAVTITSRIMRRAR